jgi:hypothetical protein
VRLALLVPRGSGVFRKLLVIETASAATATISEPTETVVAIQNFWCSAFREARTAAKWEMDAMPVRLEVWLVRVLHFELKERYA